MFDLATVGATENQHFNEATWRNEVFIAIAGYLPFTVRYCGGGSVVVVL